MNEAQEYARALTAYRKALTRLRAAKAALAASKAKPPPRTYTLAEIDAMFPPIGHTIQWPKPLSVIDLNIITAKALEIMSQPEPENDDE